MRAWRPEPRTSANPVLTLWDAAVQHYNIRFTCWNCKRVSVFHAAALWWYFKRKGWYESLGEVQKRVRCSGCQATLPCLAVVNELETNASLPMPSKLDWKQEARRRR